MAYVSVETLGEGGAVSGVAVLTETGSCVYTQGLLLTHPRQGSIHNHCASLSV